MLVQKLYKNGNSVAVTIPKEILKELNLSDGSEVVVKKRGKELIVAPHQKTAAPGVNVKFMKMVDNFVKTHEDVLQELARK